MAMLHKNASTVLGRPCRSNRVMVCAATRPSWQSIAAAGAAAVSMNLLASQMAYAAFKLPPIDTAPDHCDRGYDGNTIGQANAVSDRILDLRKCQYKGGNLRAKVLAGALMSDADFTGANMQEVVLTKAYARKAIFDNADLTNGILDRIDLTDASMKNVKLVNAVITGTTFENADLTGANFEDAVIGNEDVKRLCANTTLVGESREQVGCRT